MRRKGHEKGSVYIYMYDIQVRSINYASWLVHESVVLSQQETPPKDVALVNISVEEIDGSEQDGIDTYIYVRYTSK